MGKGPRVVAPNKAKRRSLPRLWVRSTWSWRDACPAPEASARVGGPTLRDWVGFGGKSARFSSARARG
jgi:hypothetical protein